MPEKDTPNNPPRQSLTWALIGQAYAPVSIPPKGWGAVESVIWDYKTWLEKLGHKVVIINMNDERKIIAAINQCRPDVVHMHQHGFFDILKQIRVPVKIFTSHSGSRINKAATWWLLCRHPVQYLKDGLFVFVLSPVWRKVFLDCGYSPAEVFVTPNGADHRRFKFRKTPLHENRSIYLGRILDNKRQHLYQTIDSIDFAGPHGDERFDKTRRNYLGEWTRDTLYEHLSDYTNLVILSGFEAAPLVVLEALVCGLGVVVSTAASVNLDTKLPWITVIPDEKITDVAFVEAEIARNREISLRHREQIREYGIENFCWEKLVPHYADLCLKLHAERTGGGGAARSAATLRRLRYLLPALP
ncbi:MAG: glycosyltransferase family 4 protein, partial [Gammaproteobacteria bacterium]|nr:glycosyltransferase family 4 protein [Gammaproteobacteria bacterium]